MGKGEREREGRWPGGSGGGGGQLLYVYVYVYAITRGEVYTMAGVRGAMGMSGGMGCIALYPVFFSIPWVRAAAFFSSLTTDPPCARARSFYSRYTYERRAIRFAYAEKG